jgi:hypothetical protein
MCRANENLLSQLRLVAAKAKTTRATWANLGKFSPSNFQNFIRLKSVVTGALSEFMKIRHASIESYRQAFCTS